MVTLGYDRGSNGPDLARVFPDQQLVSHVFPNTSGETLRLTHISAWVGNWGGTATIRFGVWSAPTSADDPGTLLARTFEGSPSVNYMDGAGGQKLTLYLETPIDIAPGQVVCLGIASRNASAGIAMYQAQDISRPNEYFYRKNITGTTMQSASGSAVSNEGHLAMAVFGTTNNPPDAPGQLTPSGDVIGTLTPAFAFTHYDPDHNAANRVRAQLRTPADGIIRWTGEAAISVSHGGRGSITYGGPSLVYHTSYEYRVQTRDTRGAWGPYSSWVQFVPRHNNRPPNYSNDVTGAGTLLGTRSTTVSWAFSDPDYPTLPNGQHWEQFSAKQVRLVRLSDSVEVWNSGVVTTTTSEKENLRSSTAITLPAWDTQYRLYERHRDRMGAWSGWFYTHVIARSGGSTTPPSTPSGRVTNPANPGNIVFQYHNTSGISASRIEVKLRNSTGALIKVYDQSGTFTSGSTITVPWANTGFGTLANGTEYRIVTQALVNGVWTGDSDHTTIRTNARPNTPVIFGPQDGFSSNHLHWLQFNVSDPDQPWNQLTGEVELRTTGNTLIATIPMVPNPAGAHRLVADPAALESEISSYQSFTWRGRVFDGYLWSNWSATHTYHYAAVPSVTITSPTGPTVTTSQPVLAVTADAHTHWRVRAYDGSRLVYDTGEHAGTLTNHTIAATQYWQGGERWNNHEEFQWEVGVKSAVGLWGTSAPLSLTLEYVPPTQLIVESVQAMALPGCEGTHYAQVEITQPDATEEDFIRTIVDRVEIDGPAGNEIPGTRRAGHFVSGNSADTIFADFDVTSNQWYRWSFRYEVRAGVDIIESDPVYAEMMVSWHGTLLHMPFDPLGTYLWLPYGTERYEPEWEIFQGGSRVNTINGHAPLRYRDNVHYAGFHLESTFVPREGATTEQQLEAFLRLVRYQVASLAPNGRPNSVCLREGRGGSIHRLYGEIVNPQPRYSYSRLSGVDFEFTELGVHPVIEGDDD